jgi:hypothetical protein
MGRGRMNCTTPLDDEIALAPDRCDTPFRADAGGAS